MPKMKTRRSAAKRFQKTASGRFQRKRANRRHILTKKSSKRKRLAANGAMVDPADTPRIRRQLPYL